MPISKLIDVIYGEMDGLSKQSSVRVEDLLGRINAAVLIQGSEACMESKLHVWA